MVLGLVSLWGGDRLFTDTLARQQTSGNPSFPLPWGWQVASLIVIALAGFFFGLAFILPRTLSYQPRRAIILGVIPLVLLANATLLRDPRTAQFFAEHLRFIFRLLFFTVEGGPTYALAVLLGLAASSGLSGKSGQPASAGE